MSAPVLTFRRCRAAYRLWWSRVYGDGPEDYSQAEWLAEKLERGWRFDHSTHIWHHFDGVRWAPDETQRIYKAVSELAAYHLMSQEELNRLWSAKAIPKLYTRIDNEAQRKALLRLLSNPAIERALDSLATFDGYGTSGRDWNLNPDILGVQNGIVELVTGKLRNGRPEDLVTKVCGAPYDPDAPEPTRFLQFLDEVYPGDPKMVAFMQRAIGALLVGGYVKAFLILLGDTDTGKSTLIKVIAALLGDYTAPLGMKSFAKPKWQVQANSHTRDLMKLPGSRFAYAVESDDGTTLDVARIKSMTGGEPQLLAAPYGRVEHLHPVTWKLWLGTNKAPTVTDESDATWNRMQPVPHEVRFWRSDDPARPASTPEQDPTLDAELAAELPGILRLAVRWAGEYIADSRRLLPLPSAGTAKREELHNDDDLAAWFEMEMTTDPSAAITGQVAFDMYRTWAFAHAGADLSPKDFGGLLRKRATDKRKPRGGANLYLGIRPQTAAERSG